MRPLQLILYQIPLIHTPKTQLSGSKGNMSIGVHASNNVNSKLNEYGRPLRALDMSELRNPKMN